VPSISPFDYAVIVIALLLSFRTAISGWLHGLLGGKGDKHQLHSEIHGILLAVTTQAAATNQIRDAVGGFSEALGRQLKIADEIKHALAFLIPIRDCLSHISGPVGDSEASRFSRIAHDLEHIRAQTQPDYGNEIMKIGQDQLDATKRLDERLFEFVNSTKRIMHALEGGVGSDDDAVIEAARDIRARAADKGIELTLEQALKRAREQANFR